MADEKGSVTIPLVDYLELRNASDDAERKVERTRAQSRHLAVLISSLLKVQEVRDEIQAFNARTSEAQFDIVDGRVRIELIDH
ncbi:hypothetical protein LCGC14_1591810 [marine sediment metagenome]|uniref:Uncharacterized protein n=1 Tax=marine sediment metagenome TaxID=412755 RepID=A0A0F9KUG5_9ZZZZ